MGWVESVLAQDAGGAPAQPRLDRSLQVIAAPTIEPVTYLEQMQFSRISRTDERPLIEAFITAARANAEAYTGLVFLHTELCLRINEWIDPWLQFPVGPVCAVTAVKQVAEDGTETATDLDEYYLDGSRALPRLYLRDGSIAPETGRTYRGLAVYFNAGHGTEAAALPTPLKLGVQFWADAFYHRRVPQDGTPPMDAQTLLDPYRVLTL